ncbi:MAG: serine/threonine-protein kinase PknK [Myxococcota bacterium]
MAFPKPFGRYELLDRIGSGGMAEVFLARAFGAAGFEKRLVVKKIRDEHAADPHYVDLFIKEAKVGVGLNHPNLVAVYELGRVAKSWYIAMEHLHGHDLNQIQRRLRSEDLRIPVELAVWITAELARGLAYAHAGGSSEKSAGLVHRDISPHNVFLTFTGEVKVVDFGIADLVQHGGLNRGTQGGKPRYMSPEQARGEPVDPRTDIYSAGVVLWELLTGKRPVRSEDSDTLPRLREHWPEAPHGLEAIVEKSLSPSVHDRYADASEFEEDLRVWLHQQRLRAGRDLLADWLQHITPRASIENPADVDLQRLADDLAHPTLHRREPVTIATQTDSDVVQESSPPAARRHLSTVVIDVDGFTQISETLEPGPTFSRQLHWLRWVRAVADEHGGRLLRTQDQQVTLVFGLEKTRSDDVLRAVACAQSLLRRTDELTQSGLELALGIGVHKGDVTVGGGGTRHRTSPRGNTFRLATRLAMAASANEILVSRAVWDALDDRHDTEQGPPLTQRSNGTTLRTYRLLETRATWAPSASPWIRRDDEIEGVLAGFEALQDGQGASVILHGPLGCGRTRVLREVSALADRRGVAVFYGREREAGRPLSCLRELLFPLLQVEELHTRAEIDRATDRLKLMGVRGDACAALVRSLASSVKDSTFPNAAVWEAVGTVWRTLASHRPTLICLDDMQFLTAEHLVHLGRLAHQLKSVPLLLLLSVGEEVPAALTGHRAIPLRPMSPSQQTHLVAGLSGASFADDTLMAMVRRLCHGNPLYVTELVRWLQSKRRLVIVDDTATLCGEAPEALPPTLASIVSARLDDLPAGARGALQIASVIGVTFSLRLLAEVAGLDDPVPLITDLARRELVARTDEQDRWTFVSEMMRDATLGGILAAQRRAHHAMIAEVLESWEEQDRMDHLDALITHCGEGGRPLDAARYAYTAGQQHEAHQALGHAVQTYRRGLTWLKGADPVPETYHARTEGEAILRYRLGVVCMLQGDASMGRSSLTVALDIACDAGLIGLQARIHLELGRHHLHQDSQDLARAHLEAARSAAARMDDPLLELEVHEANALLAHAMGDETRSLQSWLAALHTPGIGDEARSRCLIGKANVFLKTGELEDAAPLLEQALDAARRADNRILQGRALNNLGLVHAWRDQPTEAIRCFRRALRVREGIGYSHGVAVNHHNIGDVYFMHGEHDRAAVAFKRSREIARETGWARGIYLNDLYLCFLDGLKQSDRAESCQQLETLISRAATLADHETSLTGRLLLGRLLDHDGDVGGALALLTEASREAHERHLPIARLIDAQCARIRATRDGH